MSNEQILEILTLMNQRLARIESALSKLQGEVEDKGGSPMAIDSGKGD